MISPETVKKLYTQEAPVYDTRRFGSKAGEYRFKVERLTILKHLKHSKILELGAGTARYGIFFAKLGFDYTGIDITPAMLDMGKEKAKNEHLILKLLEMDAHDLSFGDATFDNVFCDRAFKFFQNPVKVLKEAHRVLKPDGRVILNVETPKMTREYWTKHLPLVDSHEIDERIKLYFKEEISNMLKTVGFCEITTEHMFLFPHLLIQLVPSRLLNLLVKVEINAKRGLLGSKILVVGCKL